jgi:hypothetical protein
MIANWLNFLNKAFDRNVGLENSCNSKIATKLTIKKFIDLDLDVIGWYTIGHHHSEQFIAEVRSCVPGYRLYQADVEYVWAEFSNQRMELFDEPSDDAQPVTLVRYFEPLA